MANPETQEIQQLFRDAMSAAPDVTELTSESGRRVEIKRHPEPGVEILVRERSTSDAEPRFLVLNLSDATTRPACYPASVPFVPDTFATVSVLPDRTMAVWVPSAAMNDEAARSAVSQLTEKFEAVRGDLEPITERMRDVNASDPGAIEEAARGAVDSLGASVKERLRAMWEAYTTPNAEVLEELERIFDAVAARTEAAGWSRGASKETRIPFHVRAVEYSHGDQVREIGISMGMMAGPGSNVMLMQRHRDAVAT